MGVFALNVNSFWIVLVVFLYFKNEIKTVLNKKKKERIEVDVLSG